MDSFLKSAAETLQSLSVDPKKGLSANRLKTAAKFTEKTPSPEKNKYH